MIDFKLTDEAKLALRGGETPPKLCNLVITPLDSNGLVYIQVVADRIWGEARMHLIPGTVITIPGIPFEFKLS